MNKFKITREHLNYYDRYIYLDFIKDKRNLTADEENEIEYFHAKIPEIIESDSYELSMYRALRVQLFVAEYEVELAKKNLAQKESKYYSAAQREWRSLDYISFLDD
jgi:hypothetical protein